MKMINKETECSRCSKDYRQQYGCKLGSSSTEMTACQIEHTKRRHKFETTERNDMG